MVAIFLLVVALSAVSDAQGGHRRARLPPPAIPDVLPLANFTEVLQRAAAFLSTSGRHTVDLDPCVPRPASLRLFMERITLQNFRVHGVSEVSVTNVRQEPGDKAHVYFTLSLPRVDSVGLARLSSLSPRKVVDVAVNTQETQVSFKLRAAVRVIRNRPRILSLTVARSDRPIVMKSWLSQQIDGLDQNLIRDVLKKMLDPCITGVAQEFAAIANAYLRVPKIPSNHKISADVAKIVDSRITPIVSLTPYKVSIPIQLPLYPCFYDKQPISVRDVKIDGFANCSYTEAAKEGRYLQMVYQCDPKVTANVTFLGKDAKKHPFELSINTKTFVKTSLVERFNRHTRKMNILDIRVNDAYLFSYTTSTVRPVHPLAKAASECFKQFIFLEDTTILKKILHFKRR